MLVTELLELLYQLSLARVPFLVLLCHIERV